MEKEFIKFPFYIIIHPFKGYWDLKYENKGKVSVAFCILAILTIVAILKRQFTGFIVNFNNPYELNSLAELQYIVFPFFLFCVANWSITTLMDGEGKFREILMATAYALVPVVSLYVCNTIISNVITWEEATFFFFLESFAMLWFLYLLFVGIMTVHQYTVTKTIITLLITVMVMGIIIFLSLLFFSLIQQMLTFLDTVYKEIMYRV
ncbi:Yip1 family protein [Gracilibacillus marinus]|uniref:Yip1 family protein n=1 Tax=Gracilibacillus marinus TaxID=630535 RepID=A0ABV8VVQ4_9BACI